MMFVSALPECAAQIGRQFIEGGQQAFPFAGGKYTHLIAGESQMLRQAKQPPGVAMHRGYSRLIRDRAMPPGPDHVSERVPEIPLFSIPLLG